MTKTTRATKQADNAAAAPATLAAQGMNEAGRKVSKANEKKLRAALKEIDEVLALLDSDDDSEATQEARRTLQEAANLGNWLEARIHLAFTEIADHMFGDGRLVREERIALSGAIGAALDSFNAFVGENLPQVYKRSPWADAQPAEVMSEAAISEIIHARLADFFEELMAEAPAPILDSATLRSQHITEAALESDYVPLVERAVRRDGTVALKLIEPGWGTSGYYPAAVLERDGPTVFPKGTKSFWNHATASEKAERPEGDLNALAAELVSDARWQESGPAGPGLYADAKVFTPYQAPVNELAPHIGVSIRASGRVIEGSAEGRKGRIVQALTSAESVDFVTAPGAGGKILEMFEAARPARTPPKPSQEVHVNETQFQEAVTRLENSNQELLQQNARFREALLLRDARDFVRTQLAKQTIPDVTATRLLESLSANPPVTEAGELDKVAFATRISEAIQGEMAYLTQAAGYGAGRIEGMGSGGGAEGGGSSKLPSEAELHTQMVESFRALGMSEKEAESAAVGRRW